MQTLTRLDRVVIEEYYHTATMDEEVKYMKLTHLLSSFTLEVRHPFLDLPLLQFRK